MSEQEKKKVCGIVMPISAIDNCSEAHWTEVREIIVDVIECIGFLGNLVSNADDSGFIQKRIVQNLYDNPIIVCDISGRNPNVMFELGMRLAFDKPTIIIKDDKTPTSFDTSPIEYIAYPRDLRFSAIVKFKAELANKIKATYEKSTSDITYTTFLKHFGEFKIAIIEPKEAPVQEIIMDELKSIKNEMSRIARGQYPRDYSQNELDTGGDLIGKVEDAVSGKFDEFIKKYTYGAYQKNSEAYNNASEWVSAYLSDRIDAKLDIKITAVGMAYSWLGFLKKLPIWLKNNSSCQINVCILLVDPKHLEELPIAISPINWAEQSRARISDIEEMIDQLSKTEQERLCCTIKFYRELPQYHGILINNDQLFLGRTDWRFDNCPEGQPELRVGQNRYRYFNRRTTQGADRGAERVDLFLHWHDFFSIYCSTPIFDFKNGKHAGSI